MKTPRSVAMALCLALVARAHIAHAEPDTFGYGSGIDGSVLVTTPTILNDYAPVTADTGIAGSTIQMGAVAATGGSGFAPGNLVMVWQTTGLQAGAAPSGSLASISLNDQVGAYEFARIDSLAESTITLTHPLVNEYAATGAQIVRVPEYTDLSINVGTVTPYAWDGSSGGIVILFANDYLDDAGVIDASASGFRGGIDEPISSALSGCAALDGPVGSGGVSGGGAHKGEGLVPGTYSASPNASAAVYGYGDVANGGGGGDCDQAGGGGGGNGGAGGLGASSLDNARAVGGLGGAALTFDPTHYLSLGGGGGAGNDIVGGAAPAPGGTGGGAIFIRALRLNPDPQLRAQGGTPPGANLMDSTALSSGGGGAGGTVVLELGNPMSCANSAIIAMGGNGGSVDGWVADTSEGGGGGGGVAFVEPMSTWCSPAVYEGFTANGATSGDGHVGVSSGTATAFGPSACSMSTGGCGGCTTHAATSPCPVDVPVCVEADHTCVECATDADCAESLYGGVCGAGNVCGVCNATEDVCSGVNPVCDTSGARTTCVACNGDLGTSATSPCRAITSQYCMSDGSCGTCGSEGASPGCAASGGGITHSGPVCGSGGACTSVCTVDADCTAAYCDAMHACESLLPSGAPCDRAGECVADECTESKCGSGNDLTDAGTDSAESAGDAGTKGDGGAKGDAGTKGDSGARDAGSADASGRPPRDGGNGVHPAGVDSGTESADTSSSGGCSCRSARSDDVPGSALLAGLIALVVSSRRRRQRHREGLAGRSR